MNESRINSTKKITHLYGDSIAACRNLVRARSCVGVFCEISTAQSRFCGLSHSGGQTASSIAWFESLGSIRNLLLAMTLCIVSLGMSFMLTEAIGFSAFSLKSNSVSKSPEILYFAVIALISRFPTYVENRILTNR